MGLNVGTEGNDGVFRCQKVLPGHDVSGRETTCNAVVGWNGVDPENGIFDKMDQHDARDVAEGEHAVGASRAVFNGADMTFNVGDVFVGGSRVEIRMPRSEDFKFVIGEQRIDNKPAGLVEGENGVQDGIDSGDATVGESLNSGEL